MRRKQMFLKRRSFLLLLLLLFLFLVIESYLNTMSEAVLVILSPSWAFYGNSGSLKITFFSLFSPPLLSLSHPSSFLCNPVFSPPTPLHLLQNSQSTEGKNHLHSKLNRNNLDLEQRISGPWRATRAATSVLPLSRVLTHAVKCMSVPGTFLSLLEKLPLALSASIQMSPALESLVTPTLSSILFCLLKAASLFSECLELSLSGISSTNTSLWNFVPATHLGSEDTSMSMSLPFIYLFIWLRWVLVVALGLFPQLQLVNSQLQHVRSSSLDKDQTQAPCTGSVTSQPLDHQGSPFLSFGVYILEEGGRK